MGTEGLDVCTRQAGRPAGDRIPHDRLMALIQQRIVEGSVLAVLEQSLKAGVLEELKGWQPTEGGTPPGAVISPMLANLYLNPLDHEMGRRGSAMVRKREKRPG